VSSPRRRIIRPAINNHPPSRQVQKHHRRLKIERAALSRWMAKLRRAFHAVEKLQRTITRLEQKTNRPEAPPQNDLADRAK
jgi:hypothetical protein